MNILNQLFYSAKRVIVDIKPLSVRMISFIVLILILGTAFSEAFEVSSLDKIRVGYLNEDTGDNGQAIIDTLLQEESIKSLVEFEKCNSFEDGEEAVNTQELGAFVYIPDDFTDSIKNENRNGNIEVYCKKYSGVNATIIQCVMDSFANGLNTAWTVKNMTGSVENFSFDVSNNLEKMPVSQNNNISAIAYYSMSMLLMLIMYGMEYGCYGMSEDITGALGDRTRLSPIYAIEQFTGKITGFSLATFIEAVILIIFTNLVFDVYWGNNIFLLMLTVLVFCFLCNILGMTLISVTKDLKKAAGLFLPLVFIFTFLAGGFVATEFGGLERISPSYYAKSAILNIMNNGEANVTLRYTGIMLCIAIVLTIVSIFSVRRKRA